MNQTETETDTEITLVDWVSALPTREAWLLQMAGHILEEFRTGAYGPTFEPPRIRVSCGWAGSAPGGRIDCIKGVCYASSASADETAEIFISPMLTDAEEIVSVLSHEICHAIAGHDAGHGEEFAKIGRMLGLEGNDATTLEAGDAYRVTIRNWLQDAPAYPHAALTPPTPPPPSGSSKREPAPKQTTRLLKAMCHSCGYVIRITMKWASRGLPLCPCNNQPMNLEERAQKE